MGYIEEGLSRRSSCKVGQTSNFQRQAWKHEDERSWKSCLVYLSCWDNSEPTWREWKNVAHLPSGGENLKVINWWLWEYCMHYRGFQGLFNTLGGRACWITQGVWATKKEEEGESLEQALQVKTT